MSHVIRWTASSEFVSSSIPSWQILTAHAQPFRGARDLAFCLKVPLNSLLVWVSSGGSGETARMRRLAWTFAALIGDMYQIRLTGPRWWFVSSSVNSFLWMHMCSHPEGPDVWLVPSATSILYVCEQRRLWQECVDVQPRLSLSWLPMWYELVRISCCKMSHSKKNQQNDLCAQRRHRSARVSAKDTLLICSTAAHEEAPSSCTAVEHIRRVFENNLGIVFVTEAILMSTHNICFNGVGWMDELGFYVPSTVFQSFRDEFLWITKENYPLIITKYPPYLFCCSTHGRLWGVLCIFEVSWCYRNSQVTAKPTEWEWPPNSDQAMHQSDQCPTHLHADALDHRLTIEGLVKTDQTAWKCRLIWVFFGCTIHFCRTVRCWVKISDRLSIRSFIHLSTVYINMRLSVATISASVRPCTVNVLIIPFKRAQRQGALGIHFMFQWLCCNFMANLELKCVSL